jgi:hypothetical protein
VDKAGPWPGGGELDEAKTAAGGVVVAGNAAIVLQAVDAALNAVAQRIERPLDAILDASVALDWDLGLPAAVTGIGPSQDSPDFTPALRQAAALMDLGTVLADAGYDAEHNHRLCRDDLGIGRSVIALNRRNAGRRWPKTPYRRAPRQHFPYVLYHQRWHIESGFSQHKRRLGSALTPRGQQAQKRELILRVLTHKLMILRLQSGRFQQSNLRALLAMYLPDGMSQVHAKLLITASTSWHRYITAAGRRAARCQRSWP